MATIKCYVKTRILPELGAQSRYSDSRPEINPERAARLVSDYRRNPVDDEADEIKRREELETSGILAFTRSLQKELMTRDFFNDEEDAFPVLMMARG